MIVTPRSIAEALAQRAEEFVEWLLPDGKKVGTEWCVGSVKGEAGNSCKIQLEGDKVGRWADFAEGDEHRGDLVDLLAFHRGVGIGPALTEACAWLGIERPEWNSRKQPDLVEVELPEDARGLGKAADVVAWLQKRGISGETAKRYKLVAQGKDTVIFPYFVGDKIAHLKYRSVREKKFWSSKSTGKYLFGWQALNPTARSVILTEGEMDALALAEYGFQALSIPFGAGKKGKQDWIEAEWERLERFDTIYLSMDWDAAGHNTIQELADRLGRERCRKLILPGKDANACLINGIARDKVLTAIREAKPLDPDELKNAAEFSEQVVERFYPTEASSLGFALPWAALSEYRLSWGEVTVLAGFSSHGKSTVAGQVTLDALAQHVTTCVASLEFKAAKWLQWQVRQGVGRSDPTREEVGTAMEWLGQNLWVVDTHKVASLDRILSVFQYAARRYGVKLFILDNFSKLDIKNDDFAGQAQAINRITEFAIENNVHFLLLHHLRKEETDMALQTVSKHSLKGSSAIADMVDNVFVVFRHRRKEQRLKDPAFLDLSEEDQDKIRKSFDTMITCEKHRDGGEEPRLPLWFDYDSHLFVEKQGNKPKRYIK